MPQSQGLIQSILRTVKPYDMQNYVRYSRNSGLGVERRILGP